MLKTEKQVGIQDVKLDTNIEELEPKIAPDGGETVLPL